MDKVKTEINEEKDTKKKVWEPTFDLLIPKEQLPYIQRGFHRRLKCRLSRINYPKQVIKRF